ncbi:polyketide synthase dehydratase domain-containing protein, partial [Mycobacterium ulcerans]
EDTDIDGYGIHPALFDAALHPLLALTQPPTNDTDDTNTADTGDQVRLPYAFTGISLHATHATRLRVRLTRTGADAITVHTSDTT